MRDSASASLGAQSESTGAGLDITRLDVTELLHGRVALGKRLHDAASLEEAAQTACRYFYEDFRTSLASNATRACVLVRCFKTHPYGRLEPALQQCARELLPPGRVPDERMPCLTLMASMGDEPSWCSRHESRKRRCLPLESPSAIERAPMWSQFFQETGVDTATLFHGRSRAFVDETPRAVNVFCVEEAVGAPSVPDQQEFVLPYGVRSVFGFCSQLRRGDLGVVVLFSRLPVTRAGAARIRPLALDVTSTFFRFPDEQTFAAHPQS